MALLLCACHGVANPPSCRACPLLIQGILRPLENKHQAAETRGCCPVVAGREWRSGNKEGAEGGGGGSRPSKHDRQSRMDMEFPVCSQKTSNFRVTSDALLLNPTKSCTCHAESYFTCVRVCCKHQRHKKRQPKMNVSTFFAVNEHHRDDQLTVQLLRGSEARCSIADRCSIRHIRHVILVARRHSGQVCYLTKDAVSGVSKGKCPPRGRNRTVNPLTERRTLLHRLHVPACQRFVNRPKTSDAKNKNKGWLLYIDSRLS